MIASFREYSILRLYHKDVFVISCETVFNALSMNLFSLHAFNSSQRVNCHEFFRVSKKCLYYTKESLKVLRCFSKKLILQLV